MKFYFEANEVTSDTKKRAILLTVIGQRQFRLLKDLCQPSSPGEKSFEELTDLLKNFHEPPPPKYLQRAKFDKRNRKHGESIQCYVAELRSIAEHCQFGTTLQDRLCERFITGLDIESIQRKLLFEKELTLEKAIEIAHAYQQTAESAHQLTSTAAAPNFLYQRTAPKPALYDKRPKMSSSSSASGRKPQQTCSRCGGPHHQSQCKFRNASCYSCGRVGHIAKVCQSASSFGKKNEKSSNFQSKLRNHCLTEATPPVDNDNVLQGVTDTEYKLFSLGNQQHKPHSVNILVDNRNIDFQIDTGSSLTVMTKGYFHSVFGNVPLSKSDKTLSTYTGESVQTCGEKSVKISYGGQQLTLPLLIVEGRGPPLLGRNWLSDLKLKWHELFYTSTSAGAADNSELSHILNEYDDVFNSTGRLQNFTAKIHLEPNARPIFKKARQPPYALREGIETELARLQRDGIIKPVEFSDWATPIVPVQKKSGAIRICGDYKTTVNQSSKCDSHPIPRIEDLAQRLAGGTKFTKLDFTNAYTQLELDEDSKKLTTINTHKGLFEYQRLCFGISSAPGIFQRAMESTFQHVPNTVIYFDDLYVTGQDDRDHMTNLRQVLETCRVKGLAVNRAKCQFMKDEVTFLGHMLSRDGLRPLKDTVKAIIEAPDPQNIHELRSYLGLVNHYSKFIEGSASILAPLYDLLHKNTRWCWGKIQREAFQESKRLLSSDKVLSHFDPSKPIILTCDASPVGLGAVLSQLDTDGNEKPVCYASRSLSSAERKYSQIDKEALSIIFGVKRFHKYILCQQIKIVTDHKPLLGLLGEGKPIPEHASARVQRWALTLAAYSYSLEYRPGRLNNADAFSRLPLPCADNDPSITRPAEVDALFNFIEGGPLSSVDIAQATKEDPLLQNIFHYTVHGWPEKCPTFNNRPDKCDLNSNRADKCRDLNSDRPDKCRDLNSVWPDKSQSSLIAFFNRRGELSVDNGCLLWGTRIVIPECLHQEILNLIHDTHIGVARMKAIARSWVWWPNIDADIERSVKLCYPCQKHRNEPAKAPLNPWEWPTEPWDRIHCDFAGPFLGHMYLIIVDSHSKWIDVKIMNKITASETILELRDVFSTMGLCKTLVTDNGPTFTSEEFAKFMLSNGIKHVTVSPYHPSSNGLAERAVQTFKSAMVKLTAGSCIKEKVCRFLTKYRCTPHSTTGLSPSELMFGRKTRTHLDLLHPSLNAKVIDKQLAQKTYFDKSACEREICVNDEVFLRNYDRNNKDKWSTGIVTEQTGPVSFRVLSEGKVVRRHQNQLRSTPVDIISNSKAPTKPLSPKLTTLPPNDNKSDEGGEKEIEIINNSSSPMPNQTLSPPKTPLSIIEPRRSHRERKAPERLDL